MKACSQCGITKPITDYYARGAQCKICIKSNVNKYRKHNMKKCQDRVKNWQTKNPIHRKLADKKYYNNNRDKIIARSTQWQTDNPEKVNEKSKQWKKNNKGVVNALTAQYRAQKLKATPPWFHLVKDEVTEIYKKCAERSELTNVQHHVDHIIPLQHPLVCGLHVPWNLQILEGTENLMKSNKFTWTLFP